MFDDLSKYLPSHSCPGTIDRETKAIIFPQLKFCTGKEYTYISFLINLK